jgi:phosphoglycerate dehydrogenase-like enzyme
MEGWMAQRLIRQDRAMKVLNQMGPEWALAITEALPDVEVVEVPLAGPFDPGLSGDVLFASQLGDAVVALAPRVPWVHFAGTGVDGVPPEVFAGPIVTCTRGATAAPISEYVLLAMLAFEKRLPSLWITEPPAHWYWTRLGTLEGATLGLVGFGAINQAVAHRALVFGMEVRALRRHDRPSGVAGVDVVTDLHDLMAWSDHVVIAAPATVRTHHLLDAAAFAAAKRGFHLVNVARGTLVDQDALRVALDESQAGFATLDVVEPEPLPQGHWLYTHERVRMSAHVSWSSPRLLQRAMDQGLENLRRRRAGEPLIGLVDPVEGY